MSNQSNELIHKLQATQQKLCELFTSGANNTPIPSAISPFTPQLRVNTQETQDKLINKIHHGITRHPDYKSIADKDKPFLKDYIELYVNNPLQYPIGRGSMIHNLVRELGNRYVKYQPEHEGAKNPSPETTPAKISLGA